MKKAPTVITGTVGSDSHVIGTKVLSRALKDAGFNVVALGIQVSPEEFIKVAQETHADAILMSSLYGMADIDLKDFKQKKLEAGLGDVICYIGGMLGIGRHDFKEDEEKYKELGLDRVYPPDVDLEKAFNDLRNDLKKKGKM